jgi:hypothetical protein
MPVEEQESHFMNYQVVLWRAKLREDPSLNVPYSVLIYAFEKFVPDEIHIVDR